MKQIAIIGQPNVGKSSFFNRVLRKHDAITSDIAGTTRDTKRRVVKIFDKSAEMVDTGGLDKNTLLFDKIKEISLKAAYKADIIIFMVDGRSIPRNEDKKLFYELECMKKDVALVVNKLDNDKLETNLWDYQSFGTDNIFPISVAHNRHITALLEWIYKHISKNNNLETKQKQEINSSSIFDDKISNKENFSDDNCEFLKIEKLSDAEIKRLNDIERKKSIKVAIIGRVNVGKSSLLNSLLDQERSVVSSIAGTTIDPVDETIIYDSKKITFVDTAGIRSRGKIVGIEKYALMRTEDMLKNADVALLILDACEPFKDLDEKIAGLIDKNRLASLIVLNKWDLTDKNYEKAKENVRSRFKFLHYAPIITISALTKMRVQKIFSFIIELNDNYSKRISTSKLNEVIKNATRQHHLPSPNGKTLRIYYTTQFDIRPPQIALIINKPRLLHFSYRRYLVNKIRETFNFEGTPILLKAKSRDSLYDKVKE